MEKPFGTDLESARALQAEVTKVFEEKHVYRIDHYLGKEPVQDIMALRFANVIFEPIWNRRYVDCIQITAAETVGVEGRGGYYEVVRCAARHDSESRHQLARAGGHGAADLAGGRSHPRREVQSALGAATDLARRRSRR